MNKRDFMSTPLTRNYNVALDTQVFVWYSLDHISSHELCSVCYLCL